VLSRLSAVEVRRNGIICVASSHRLLSTSSEWRRRQ